MLLQRLLDALNSFSKPPTKYVAWYDIMQPLPHTALATPSGREHSFARLLVSLYLVHLLDCEWQGYDYTLLSELQLPDFLFQSAISEHSHPPQ